MARSKVPSGIALVTAEGDLVVLSFFGSEQDHDTALAGFPARRAVPSISPWPWPATISSFGVSPAPYVSVRPAFCAPLAFTLAICIPLMLPTSRRCRARPRCGIRRPRSVAPYVWRQGIRSTQRYAGMEGRRACPLQGQDFPGDRDRVHPSALSSESSVPFHCRCPGEKCFVASSPCPGLKRVRGHIVVARQHPLNFHCASGVPIICIGSGSTCPKIVWLSATRRRRSREGRSFPDSLLVEGSFTRTAESPAGPPGLYSPPAGRRR